MLTRARALAYRVQAHGLDRPAPDLFNVAVLATGARDAPPGRTAPLALAVRAGGLTHADVAARIADGSLAAAYTVRAAMHVHAGDHLGRLASALRVRGGDELAVSSFGRFGAELAGAGLTFDWAVDHVAAAMRDVMADGTARTKGELSVAVIEITDARLRPWCDGCGAHHVHDGLFRFATLRAGLRLVYDPSPSAVRLVRADRTRTVSAATARADLVRDYLRLAGPTTPAALAAWLGLTPAAARKLWPTASVAPVDVEGARRWMHADDLAAVPKRAATGAVLIAAYDPFLETADRELLVPDGAARRQVWRATQNPGVLLLRGEVAGVWRHRTTRNRLDLTLRPRRPLTAADRRAVERRTAHLADALGLADAVVTIDGPD
jgi:hypothetical protein